MTNLYFSTMQQMVSARYPQSVQELIASEARKRNIAAPLSFEAWEQSATPKELAVRQRILDYSPVFADLLEAGAKPEMIPAWAYRQVLEDYHSLFKKAIVRIESVPEGILRVDGTLCWTAETDPGWPLKKIADAVYLTPCAAESDELLLHLMAYGARRFFAPRTENAALAAARLHAEDCVKEKLLTEMTDRGVDVGQVVRAYRDHLRHDNAALQRQCDWVFALICIAVEEKLNYPSGTILGCAVPDRVCQPA